MKSTWWMKHYAGYLETDDFPLPPLLGALSECGPGRSRLLLMLSGFQCYDLVLVRDKRTQVMALQAMARYHGSAASLRLHIGPLP